MWSSHVGNHPGSSSLLFHFIQRTFLFQKKLSKLICLSILTFSSFSAFVALAANKELCHYAVGFLFAMEKDLSSQCHTHVIHVIWIARFQVNRTMGRKDRLSTHVFNNCGEKWNQALSPLGMPVLRYFANQRVDKGERAPDVWTVERRKKHVKDVLYLSSMNNYSRTKRKVA